MRNYVCLVISILYNDRLFERDGDDEYRRNNRTLPHIYVTFSFANEKKASQVPTNRSKIGRNLLHRMIIVVPVVVENSKFLLQNTLAFQLSQTRIYRNTTSK